MDTDIMHCFDFDDDICPQNCLMAQMERDLDGADNDVSPVFLTYKHFKNAQNCPLNKPNYERR